MHTTRVLLAVAGLATLASAFSPAQLPPRPSLRSASTKALSMARQEGGGGVSRKSFLALGLGLLSAAALPAPQVKAEEAEVTAEQRAEYRAMLKQMLDLDGAMEGAPRTALKSSVEYLGEAPERPPEPPAWDPFLDSPQTLINIEDLQEEQPPPEIELCRAPARLERA